MIDRVLIGEEGRQVEDDLGPLEEDALQLDLVPDVALDEQDAGQRWDVPPLRGRKVVQKIPSPKFRKFGLNYEQEKHK
jgi:hypothetical protein